MIPHKQTDSQTDLSIAKRRTHSTGSTSGAGEFIGQPNALRAQLMEHGLGQRDLAAERRMHSVVEQMLVEQTVVADGMEIRLAVDQDATKFVGHLVIDLLEFGRAAHRITVEIACKAIVAISLVP